MDIEIFPEVDNKVKATTVTIRGKMQDVENLRIWLERVLQVTILVAPDVQSVTTIIVRP